MRIKAYIKPFLLVLLALTSFRAGFAQQNDEDQKQQKEVDVQDLLKSKNFVFVVRTVLPMGGRSITPTSTYDLTISGDTLVSNLPYFGRSFVAPMNPSEAGIRFTSNDFTYTVKERKKGGWDISILPKDAKDVRQMYLNVTDNGYASLQIISNNRQSIGYNGAVGKLNQGNVTPAKR